MSETKIYGSVDEMLTAGALDADYVEIEGFAPGTMIRLGSVTAGDMIEWSEANEGEAKRTAGIRLITKSLVNEQGQRISSDKDIAKFKLMRHRDTERIVQAILDLNGMTIKKDKATKND